jgi:hypothetical protein
VRRDCWCKSVLNSFDAGPRRCEIQAHAKKHKAGTPPNAENGTVEVSPSGQKKASTASLVLEAFCHRKRAFDCREEWTDTAESDSDQPATLPAGTRCKILLLTSLSASKSKRGDAVQARLLEPVLVNSQVVLPAGSLIKGKVGDENSAQMVTPGRISVPDFHRPHSSRRHAFPDRGLARGDGVRRQIAHPDGCGRATCTENDRARLGWPSVWG